MRKHVICGLLGPSDQFSPEISAKEFLTSIQLVDIDGQLNYGIGHSIHDLEKMSLFPSEIGVDLLILAAHVQAADTRISRKTESQDSWTREIRLIIPVSNLDRWNRAAGIIKGMLDFLTGDLWEIQFRQRPAGFDKFISGEQKTLTEIPFNSLALFSGGLDSLIGAIDSLGSGESPLFISHASDGATSQAQNSIFKRLKEKYPERIFDRIRMWMSFSNKLIDRSEVEKTTRSRSFLFFSLGIFTGTCFHKSFTLRIPENGLIALNVPLDSLRLGSHSTHTTHTYYVSGWNELLSSLHIPGHVENPYWDKTKGEMVKECVDQELLQELSPISLSCSSPSKARWRGNSTEHCGYCVPCLIRRAAIEKGLGKGMDKTTYTLQDMTERPLDTLVAEGQQVRSFQLAIRRLHAHSANAEVLIHNSGPLKNVSLEDLNKLASVYARGMEEVAELLTNVRTEPQK